MIVLEVLGGALTLLLAFVLPGLALFKSRLFSEYRLHWLAKVLLVVALSASLASLVTLFLAEAGFFRVWLLDLILGAVAVAVHILFGNTHRPVFLGARPREVLVVAALVAVGVALFFMPFEVVMGDGDPGYNFNMGYHLAHTGEMTIHDPSVPAMSDMELRTFFQKDVVQFLPFHLRVRETGRIQPLLYHMLPAWIGLFIAVMGTWGGFFVVPVFMLLSVLAVYALVRRYTGVFGAAAAALLMEMCFLVVYFARLPISEAGCGFFMLASLLFYAEYIRAKGTATALASAAAAAAAFAFRPEALVLVVPMLAVEAVEMFRGRYSRGDLVFTNALLAGLLYTWFYMRFVGYFYLLGNMRRVFSVFGDRNGVSVALDIFLGCIVAAVVLFNIPALSELCARIGARISTRAGALRERSPAVVSAVMAALLLLVFVYLYAFLPRGRLNVESSRRFFFYTAGYFGGLAVFVFIVGLCAWIMLSREAAFSFVLASSVILLAVVFSESNVTSGYQPWLTRRFMSLVVPVLFAGLGYLLGRLWDSRKAWLMTAAALAAALFLAFFVYTDVPLFGFVQYEGVNAQIERLAEKVDGSLVVFTNPFEGEALGLALRYQHGVDARRAYTLGDDVDFERTVREYASQGKKVLIEAKGLSTLKPGSDLLDKVSFVKAFDAEISFERMAQTYKVLPRTVGKEKHDITFYYVVPK